MDSIIYLPYTNETQTTLDEQPQLKTREEIIDETSKKIQKIIQPRQKLKQTKITENQYKSQKTKKKTYQQNWSNYNLAQTKEIILATKIINDLINYKGYTTITKKTGRPSAHLSDILKSIILKIYNTKSTRRNQGHLHLNQKAGHLIKTPHFNTIIKYLNNPQITPILTELITETSKPLVSFESHFSPDATGFSTFNKKQWINIRLETKEKKDYKKLHIMTGTQTNTITYAIVSDGQKHDSPFFKELIIKTKQHFNLKEISADPGYLSRENTQLIADNGAEPYILPKKNSTAKSKGYPAWRKMIKLFQNNEELFRQHYHIRSNVESTFAMIKRKFDPFVRSKNNTSQINEALCKVICHNIYILIHTIIEFDLKIDFLE